MNDDVAKRLLVEKVLGVHNSIEEAVVAAVEQAFEAGYGWGFEDAYLKDPIPEELDMTLEARYEG